MGAPKPIDDLLDPADRAQPIDDLLDEDDDVVTGDPSIDLERVPLPPKPRPVYKPAPGAPIVGQRETAVTELQQGSSGSLIDEAKAGTAALDNYLRSKGAGGVARHVPIIGPALEASDVAGRPEAAGRGMGAPLKGYDDYLRQYAERRAEGKNQNPQTAFTANLAGSVAAGAMTPQIKAAEGAGLLARAGAGIKNVGVDTALSSATAAAGADPGKRLEAAQDALLPSALISTALRTPGAARAVADAGRKVSLAGLPEDIRPAAEELSEISARGAAARASAREGQKSLGPTNRAITKTLSDAEAMTDAVLDYGRVGMKRAPIVKAMAAEGVDAQQAVMSTGGAVERIAMELDELANMPVGDMQVGGRQAVKQARDAFDAARDQLTEALGRTADEGGDAAADAYMRVDQLKRQLGKAVKRAGGGSDPDQMVEEVLMRQYATLRELLEDEKTWGTGAATVQREVNAAWTPWLDQRKAFEQGFLTDTARKRGANSWDPLKEADPKKIGAALRNAGADDATNELIERDLRQGLETTQKLTGTLAKHYDAPPDIVDKAASVAEGAGKILGAFDDTTKNLTKARELRDVTAAAPSIPFMPRLGSAINAGATVEELARQNPGVTKAVGAVAGAAEPVRKVAAMQSGQASAEGQNDRASAFQRTVEKPQEQARAHLGAETAENAQLMDYINRKLGPAEGEQVSQDDRATDLATQDEEHGQLLASKQGQDRATTYSVLMKTDGQFRARQRERAKQLQQQQEEQQEQ